jgi:hypothetical protein
MDPSSTAARVLGQPVTCRTTAGPAAIRKYRRDRQHLYPLEDFNEAAAVGGTVRSFCGIEVALICGDTADVVEATKPAAEDCLTCVDIWRGSRLVRL